MNTITTFLDRMTMYRLVLYGLALIVGYACVLSALGALSFTVDGLGTSLVLLLTSCWATNYILSRLYGSTTSIESIWITALILFLILAPPASLAEAAIIVLAGALAMVSKYVLAVRKKHIFNPAAISLAILSIAGSGLASWWVGSPLLLPVVAIVGFLIVRKIHRFDVLWAFVAASAGVTLLFVIRGTPLIAAFSSLVISGPLVFFSTIMLTEPLSMPPSRALRIVYGIIVGGLYASQFHFGFLYATPHLALVAGNLYSYVVSSKQRLLLSLRSVERLSQNVYEFVFRPNQQLAFAAGQYLEWTLPHASPDSGGNRRYFTIASSPTQRDVRIGVRINERPSSFKKSLLSMREGAVLTATSLSGDFVLPSDAKRKLLFIAGGVGITPFVSMIRHLLEIGEKRDIVLLYLASSENDLAYRSLIERAARAFGLRVVYITGRRIDSEMLSRQVPDLLQHSCFISGPDAMVKTYKHMLFDAGVAKRNIRTDYFTGFGAMK